MIAAADDALYEAKRRGRDLTVVGQARIDQVAVTGSNELDAARRVVERAATRAQLTPEQTVDAKIGVSEACLRLLRPDDRAAELAVTIHERAETFTIIVEDRAAERTIRRQDELNATVLGQVGNEVRVDERDFRSEVRIVFTKPDPTGARADATSAQSAIAANALGT
jgi:hypothetical protein